MHEVSGAEYWRRRYREQAAGWDLGGPCPVFRDLLDSPLAPPLGRVAFPGCGTGHDLRLFLDRGYDAMGFDFAIEESDLPIEPVDVFELGWRFPGEFDVIVEYTCYCAIDPKRRVEYVASLRAALRPGGLLVALLFPVEHRSEGPPFGIEEQEIDHVLGVGMDALYVETPRNSVPERMDRERLVILRKR